MEPLARIVLAAVLVTATPALAAVHKCRDASGALSYQELPCGESQQPVKADIASEFPPPNLLERERTLQREAELYRRLEAQRDRLSAEAIARITRPEPVPVAVEPAGSVAWPLWPAAYPAARFPHRPQPRNAMRDWANGRLR